MALLELNGVGRSFTHVGASVDVLKDVSFALEPGELVVVWGLRGSGRTTLLRLAAGIDPPDCGGVRFGGQHLVASRRGTLPDGVAFCPSRRPGPGLGGFSGARTVLEAVMAAQLARGRTRSQARATALAALERAGAGASASLAPRDLDPGHSARVCIAAALCSAPVLLFLDEPTTGVDLLEREDVFELLRSLARDGIGVLACVSESAGLFGVDRALTLSEGRLHGDLIPRCAQIVDLPLQATA